MENSDEYRHRELARLLLQKAKQDLEATKTLGQSSTVADESVGFHAQQTVEKALKAVLTRKGIAFQFTHDLLTLFKQIENAGLTPPTDIGVVEELTPFAVQFRYALYDDAEPFERQAAEQLAEIYVEWANSIIETSLGEE